MKIEWNRVTWYSKLLAVVVFIITFWSAFCLGIQYGKVKQMKLVDTNSVVTPTSGDLTFSVGQTKNFGDLKVTLDSVPNDSRCPVDVTCIWAGAVSIKITVVSKTETVTKTIASEDVARFGDYEISVLEITPAPVSNQPITQKDYKVKIHLEKTI